MLRIALAFLAVFFFQSSASAQSAFDPEPMAYVLCVSNETKRLALVMPPVAKETVADQAFRACAGDEAELRKSLAAKGVMQSEADARVSQIQKFIRLTAPDDVERQRANRVPR
jgi:hypothetical protein